MCLFPTPRSRTSYCVSLSNSTVKGLETDHSGRVHTTGTEKPYTKGVSLFPVNRLLNINQHISGSDGPILRHLAHETPTQRSDACPREGAPRARRGAGEKLCLFLGVFKLGVSKRRNTTWGRGVLSPAPTYHCR